VTTWQRIYQGAHPRRKVSVRRVGPEIDKSDLVEIKIPERVSRMLKSVELLNVPNFTTRDDDEKVPLDVHR
jgi:hypothetical protein